MPKLHSNSLRHAQEVDVPLPLEAVRRRFEDKFIPEPNSGCWLWTAAIQARGYPIFGMNGRSHLGHRVSWTIYRGKIPDGLCACHKCDTPACVNPDHLFLGTQLENIADRQAKGRCRAAGKPGVDCGHAILDDDVVLSIRSDTKRSHSQIAKECGVARTTITNIKAGRTWKHLLPALLDGKNTEINS